MATMEVRGSDYSDEWINSFFDSIQGLKPTAVEPVTSSLMTEAEVFASSRPRPKPEIFRQYINHAVAVARGWDHPYDHDLMLDAAVKSFYVIAWLEHLQRKSLERNQAIDIRDAFKISFTPNIAGQTSPPKPIRPAGA